GSGSAVQSGRIDAPADRDVFRFTAPVAGRLTVELDPASAAAGTLLTVLDGSIQPLGPPAGRAIFDVVPGQTFYVEVTSSAGVGPYPLSFRTAAPTLPFVPDDAGRRSVAAAPSADVDLFRFVVPDTGLLIPAPGGPLAVYDQSGQALRQDNLGQFF